MRETRRGVCGPLLVLVGLSPACGGSAEELEPTKGQSATTASDRTARDGTPAGAPPSGEPGASSGDLSGVWDIIASGSNGRSTTSVMTLSPTLLDLKGDLELIALLTDSLTDIAYRGDTVQAKRTAGAALGLGILPLPLGGAWHFVAKPDEGGSCDFELSSEKVSLRCNDEAQGPKRIAGTSNADLTGQRTEARASSLGEIGGVWQVDTGNDTCVATLDADWLAVTCASNPNDALRVTFGGNRMAGGTTGGMEFVAQRR